MSDIQIHVHHLPPSQAEIETSRKFVVISYEGSSTADCFEGYDISNNGPEIVENDIFDLHLVHVSETAGHRGKGIGTLLVAKAISEAKNRGFSAMRFEAGSPRMLKIMHTLQTAGAFDSEQYAITHKAKGDPFFVKRPTSELFKDGAYTNVEIQTLARSMRIDPEEDGMFSSVNQPAIEGVVTF